MIHMSEDFTADPYRVYLVDTSNKDINVILPDATMISQSGHCNFLNKGTNSIIYNASKGQLVNDSDTSINNSQWQSDTWVTDKSNWYNF